MEDETPTMSGIFSGGAFDRDADVADGRIWRSLSRQTVIANMKPYQLRRAIREYGRIIIFSSGVPWTPRDTGHLLRFAADVILIQHDISLTDKVRLVCLDTAASVYGTLFVDADLAYNVPIDPFLTVRKIHIFPMQTDVTVHALNGERRATLRVYTGFHQDTGTLLVRRCAPEDGV